MERSDVGHCAVSAGVRILMNDLANLAKQAELPPSVRPLGLSIDGFATVVLLAVTAIVTATQFPRLLVLLISTILISVALIRYALGARTRRALALWCLIGGCAGSWLNASIGGAMALGLETLPFTLLYGFFGLPYGLVYGIAYLLLLWPLFKLHEQPSVEAPEHALAITGGWAIGVGLCIAVVPAPIWPDLGNGSQLFDPHDLRIAAAVVLMCVGVALFVGAKGRIARRGRWVERVKAGDEPGWSVAPATLQYEELPWVTPRAEQALVLSRRIDVDGFYRSGAWRPVALAAAD